MFIKLVHRREEHGCFNFFDKKKTLKQKSVYHGPQVVGIRPPVVSTMASNMTSEADNNTWENFIQSLPKWEVKLIEKSEFCTDGTKLAEEIRRRTGRIFLVTDGGAADVYGSYGWVVATKDQVLCKGRGYAKGFPMDLHRAEGIG